MKLNLKKSEIILLIVSIIITIIEIIGWFYFSGYVIIPWFKNTISKIGDWLQDQGPAALGLLVPVMLQGIVLFVIFIAVEIVPLAILMFHIIIVVCALLDNKKVLFTLLAIYGFFTLNLLSGITSIIILKQNPNA